MTVFHHAFAGAVATHVVCRVVGIDGTADAAASAVGAFLGVIPDGLDWVLAKMGRVQRWRVYYWFHNPTLGSTLLQWLLFPMALHTQVFDPLVHSPVLPPRYDQPVAVIDDRVRLAGVWITRRTLFWIYAEVASWLLWTVILLLAR